MIVAAVYDRRICGPRSGGSVAPLARRSPAAAGRTKRRGGAPVAGGAGQLQRVLRGHTARQSACELIKQEIYIAMQTFFSVAF